MNGLEVRRSKLIVQSAGGIVAASQVLDIPATQTETEDLVVETAAVLVLEGEYAAALDFGGINTAAVRCRRSPDCLQPDFLISDTRNMGVMPRVHGFVI